MDEVLKVLNDMVDAKVVPSYAIGGAIAAFYYIEATQTDDIDVFTVLPTSGLLVDIQPLYEYLKGRGYSPKDAFVEIEGWSVQFLPPAGPLEAEALQNAVEVSFNETPTKILAAEYLAAIMLKVGRNKDQIRLGSMLEYDQFDKSEFLNILSKYKLRDKWDIYSRKYLSEDKQ